MCNKDIISEHQFKDPYTLNACNTRNMSKKGASKHLGKKEGIQLQRYGKNELSKFMY